MEESFVVLAEAPFDNFTQGRVYTSKRDNRRIIAFSGDGYNTLATTYARYVFQVDYWNKFKKLIPDGYEVDHINEDKLDDRLDNLQLLTASENRIKNNLSKGIAWHVYACPVCGSLFGKRPYAVSSNLLHICSKQCLLSLQMSSISFDLKRYLLEHQLRYIIRIHRVFPSGEEKLSEIIKTLDNCFYPKSLNGIKGRLPDDLVQASVIVQLEKRLEEVSNLLDQGMSQRKIGNALGIPRHQVETAIKHIEANKREA